ncbi:sigma-54-dependent transcriptional regulator [Aliiroseovarius marinus]|uniref:sigma-54-dependent transcriptional regulator n=1 Tax=Aliiroseovarius marinus TaxID=2500159 RepID=UPI003D7C3F36
MTFSDTTKARSTSEPDVTAPNVMVICDAEDRALFPQSLFQNMGCNVAIQTQTPDAKAKSIGPDTSLLILALSVSGRSTLGCLENLMQRDAPPRVIVISTNSQINEAAKAMRLGAQDCVFRPFTQERLEKTVATLLNLPPHRLVAAAQSPQPMMPPSVGTDREPAGTQRALGDANLRHGMVLSDVSVKAILEALGTAADDTAPIFIYGDTGTGKEILARSFHQGFRAKRGAFVSVDCAHLSADTLTEAFLGTHEQGQEGHLARAHHGTLFLDQITSADLKVQRKLVHLLEHAHLPARKGHSTEEPLDVRLIASSTTDPKQDMANGRLLKELYYRLNVLPLSLPPLSERGDDLMHIAQAKLLTMSRDKGRAFRGFSTEAAAELTRHDWPGNIRELINVVWRIVLQHDGTLVTPEMLPDDLHEKGPARARHDDPQQADDDPKNPRIDSLIGQSLNDIERLVIERTIEAEGGSLPRAALVLGVSPSTLYRKRDSWQGRD